MCFVVLWQIEEVNIQEPVIEKKVLKKETPTGKCPVCGKTTFFDLRFCSRECWGKAQERIKWPSKEELHAMLLFEPRTTVAERIGVSEAAIRKREDKWKIGKYWRKNDPKQNGQGP